MPSQPLHIICSTDSNFVNYTGVMLWSLLEHNAGAHIYVLVDKSLSQAERQSILRLTKHFSCTIQFLSVDGELLQNFPTIGGTITVATYYKIFSTELLPDDLDKVLYLDSDMLVRGSLDELWNTDISDYAMAGVWDLYDNAPETYERLHYAPSLRYLNAGMLLINLRWWRQHGVYEQCLDYIRQKHEHILWCEQDVLNAVLAEHKLVLPIRFNYQAQMLMQCHYQTLTPEQQSELCCEQNPVIVHFVGPASLKPWKAESYGLPFVAEWVCAKRRSLWRFMLLELPKHNRLKTFIKRYLLWPLGWKKSILYIQS